MEGKKEIRNTEPGFHHKNLDIDANITRSFADEVMWAKGKNSPMVDWFPLTASHQHHYAFQFNCWARRSTKNMTFTGWLIKAARTIGMTKIASKAKP